MTTEAFKAAQLNASPFHPFVVHLNDGRALAVKHPDFVALSPKGWEAMIWTEASTPESIDLDAVTSRKVTRKSRSKVAA
jgi:hypothetical protein